ncbi:hypothetical protein IMZ48_01510, partial [Candidatus Bathyarchaeota archaeon]|nr:hypothetical protein [Candidatus Bathyarchaeota archaeon]
MVAPASRPALGQDVPLGTLYDCRTDTFLSRSIVRGSISTQDVSVSRKPNVELKTAICRDYQQQFGLLGFSPELIASHFAGYVQGHGSASYLHSPAVPPWKAAAVLLHKLVMCTQRLNIAAMTEEELDLEALRGVEATHIVMAVELGMQSIVEIQQKVVGDADGPAADAVLAEAERLKWSLGVAPAATHKFDKSYLEPSTPNLDIQIFSDTMKEPVAAHHLLEAGEFLSMLSTQAQQLYNGDGISVSYQLVP